MKPNEPLEELLRRLEQRLLEPEARRSPDELSKLLADDFVEFGACGRSFDRQGIIEALRGESPVQISMTDFRTVPLAPDVALVTYRAVFAAREGVPEKHSLRSSIWRLTGDTWKMVFHQGTPTS